MYTHGIMKSCGIKTALLGIELMANAVKEVGKSGQITLGKSFAGERFTIEPQPNGDFLLKRILMIPADQVWAYKPDVLASIDVADKWCAENPPRAYTQAEVEEASLLELPQ